MFVSQKKYDEIYNLWRSSSYDNDMLAESFRKLEVKYKELCEAYKLVIKGEFESVVAKAEMKNSANLFMYNLEINSMQNRAATQYNLLKGLGNGLGR
jgi:hypothetical protein